MAKTCQKCGQPFKHRKSLYCSLECSGEQSKNKKHGLSETRVYESWRKMRRRCTQTNFIDYPRYGGRGITMCARWNDFANFYADMGPRPEGHSLDRIDNNGNYEPGNCRWATTAVQNKNKRNVWTGEQDNQLRSGMRQGLSYQQIAQSMGKSWESIAARSSRLKVGVELGLQGSYRHYKPAPPVLTDKRPPMQEEGK